MHVFFFFFFFFFFCYVSKSFDRVWHKGLIFKLKQHGIDGSLLNWISTSTAKRTNAGVPQGSVLEPLLFLIDVNAISDSLLSLTRLFADDSSLFYSAALLEGIQEIINHDIRFPHCMGKTMVSLI